MSAQITSKAAGLFRPGHLPKVSTASKPALKSLQSKTSNNCISLNSPAFKSFVAKYARAKSISYKTSALSSTLTLARSYSSRDTRRQRQAQPTQVQGREQYDYNSDIVPVQQQTHQQPRQEHREEIPADSNQFQSLDPNATTEELVTPGVLAHIRKVYTTLAVAVGAASLGGLGAVMGGLTGGAAIVFSLGALAPLLGVLFMSREKVLLRQNLLFLAAAMMGLGAGPLLGAATLSTIALAAGGTGAIFAGFSLAALKAKSTTFLKFGGLMMGGLFVILGAALLGMVGPMIGLPASVIAALYSVNLYGGLAIMSLYVAWDTQNMIARAATGDADHVSDALNMFIDVWSIFVRLLASTFIVTLLIHYYPFFGARCH